MATVREIILPHHKKEDGTWNVKIRILHKNQASYINTQHFVGSKQIRKDFTIKDPFILKLLSPVLNEYRAMISEMNSRLAFYTAKSLAGYLSNGGLKKPEEINIIEFGRQRIEQLKAKNRNGSAANMVTVVNSLLDYFKSEFVPITEIRAKMLLEYEAYLSGPRTITRYNQFKEPVTRKVEGLKDTGLHNHMRDLRILFNNILEHYNDEDMGVIIVKHYPFKKYKLVEVAENIKQKLTVKQVRSIRDCEAPSGSRMEQARDLFMLSFYLCGMNAVDLWKLKPDAGRIDRVEYKRSKTSNRRRDEAFISINIPQKARDLYLKYARTLQTKYSSHITLDQALSKGMKAISKKLGFFSLEFYDARHAFGDLARNKCRFSKDDVGLALNHKDQSNRITDTYISKNWDIVDEVQAAVVGLLDIV